MPLIQHRAVWYFHGFDPASTARYRRIFESASARHGVTLADLPGDADGWRAERDGVTTDLHYLRYDDLVREAQRGSVLARFGRGVRTQIALLSGGLPGRVGARTLALLISPTVVGVAGLLLAVSFANIHPVVGPLAAVLVLWAVWQLLVPMRMLLVADLFACMRMLASGRGAAWEDYLARIDALGGEITPGEADETLVVGHSLGGVAAIHSVAGLLDRWDEGRPLGLLTLGSVHGIVLAQRGEGRDLLADAVARICTDPRVFWVDVSAPRDAFCVALTDPLCLIGDRAQTGMASPRVISAPLARAPRIPGDRRTLFSAMRLHMGYLLAAPDGAGFDYADTVTGAETLAGRFGPRGNSPKARMRQP